MVKTQGMLTAQDVQRLTGVSRDMFHLWQRMGLLPDYTRFERQGKTGGGWAYPAEILEVVARIKELKRRGKSYRIIQAVFAHDGAGE
jgi:DNA-binding transcriptional MerR regulator